MTLNRRETIKKALRVAELIDRYIPTAFEKDEDLGEGLLAEMADVLEEVRGAMAAPDNTTQESLRRLAAKASGLLEEYTRRRRNWKPSKKDQMPAEEIGEGDDQEEVDEESSEDDESPVEADLKKSVKRRLQGRLNERDWWSRLGYR
jgi:hypothetical protein